MRLYAFGGLSVITAGSTEARAASRPGISTCHWAAAGLRLTRPQDTHTQTHTVVSSLIAGEPGRSKVSTAVAFLDDKSLAEGQEEL